MREHAHQLLDRLDHSQLAAIVHLLETIIPPGDDGGDTLSHAEREKIAKLSVVLRASETAVELTDIVPRPMLVCERALRPTRMAVWKRRESAGVCVPAAVAAVNAPRT